MELDGSGERLYCFVTFIGFQATDCLNAARRDA